MAGASGGVAVDCDTKTSKLADVLAQEEAELRGLIRLSQQRIETLEDLLVTAEMLPKEPEDTSPPLRRLGEPLAQLTQATSAEAAGIALLPPVLHRMIS